MKYTGSPAMFAGRNKDAGLPQLDVLVYVFGTSSRFM